MTRRRCYKPWYGDCASSIVREHCCARPPGHPDDCTCACGSVRPEDGAYLSDPDVRAMIRRAARLKATHDRAVAARKAATA